MTSVSELNKLKVRLFVEAVCNEGRLELVDELVAADYIGRVLSLEGQVLGPEGVRRLVACVRRAHPDLYIKIEDQVAEDDRVVTRWHATVCGRELRAADARTVRIPCSAGISIVRLLAGKQVDSHTGYTSLDSRPPTPRLSAARPTPGAWPRCP